MKNVLAMLVVAVGVGCPGVGADGVMFYVSSRGNDAWSGRSADPAAGGGGGPFRTVSRARDAVRAVRRENPDSPAIVEIRDGTYYLDDLRLLP